MLITIAIPTFNRADSLADTLRSVAGLAIPDRAPCEVLIVDNNSTDHTQSVLAEMSPSFPMPLRGVVEPRLGLCFARNRALREAGDHVVFLDDDVHVATMWLVAYMRAVAEFRSDCVVGPVVPVFPKTLPPYVTRYVLSLIGSDYSRKGHASLVLPSQVAHEIPGCNFGVSRDVALDIGGFHNALDRVGAGLLAGGDTEFGIRLVKAGKRVVYEPGCRIEHLISLEKLERAYLRHRANGLGLTSARLRSMHGPHWQVRDWLRASKRAMGLYARWQLQRLMGRRALAFEWELRTRRHVVDWAASFYSK